MGYAIRWRSNKRAINTRDELFPQDDCTIPAVIPNTSILSLYLKSKTTKSKGATNMGLLISLANKGRRNRASLYLLVDSAVDIENILIIKQADLAR